jgi:hypothetical protein
MLYRLKTDFPVRYKQSNGVEAVKVFKQKDGISGYEEGGFVYTTVDGAFPPVGGNVPILKVPVGVLIAQGSTVTPVPTPTPAPAPVPVPMPTRPVTPTKLPEPFKESPKTPSEPPVTVSFKTQAATPILGGVPQSSAPESPFIQIPNTNISINRNVPNILNVLNIRKVERNEVKRARRAQEIFERLLAGYTMPSNEDTVKIAQYAMEMAKKDKTAMPENQGVGGFIRGIFGGKPRGFAGE